MIFQVTCNQTGVISKRQLRPNEKLDLNRLIRKWCKAQNLSLRGLEPIAVGQFSAKLAEDPDSVVCWESMDFWAEVNCAEGGNK